MFRTCIVDTNTNLVVNVIEYENEQTGSAPGMPANMICVLSETGQINGVYKNGEIINPDPVFVVTPEMNKDMATAFLQQTDWATIPDVSDPAKSNPYLANVDEFIAYRNTIRKIAINPPSGQIEWANPPVAKWL